MKIEIYPEAEVRLLAALKDRKTYLTETDVESQRMVTYAEMTIASIISAAVLGREQ